MIGCLAMAKAVFTSLAALPSHHMRWRLMSRAPWNNVILSVRWERTLSVAKRSHVRWTAQNALVGKFVFPKEECFDITVNVTLVRSNVSA